MCLRNGIGLAQCTERYDRRLCLSLVIDCERSVEDAETVTRVKLEIATGPHHRRRSGRDISGKLDSGIPTGRPVATRDRHLDVGEPPILTLLHHPKLRFLRPVFAAQLPDAAVAAVLQSWTCLRWAMRNGGDGTIAARP